MIGLVARAQTGVSIAQYAGLGSNGTARMSAAMDGRLDRPLRAKRAPPGALDAAFAKGGGVIALHGPRDIHASIADFVRDNEATLSRCTTPDAVADVLVRKADAPSTERWITLATTQSGRSVRAQARAAAMRAGLPPFAVDAVAGGVVRGASRLVVDTTMRRPLQRSYVDALTKRNAVIEATTNDARAMKANDRLIHDLPLSSVDLTRVDLSFTQAHVTTATLGLPPRQFPYATAAADTLARAAVLQAIATDRAPSVSDQALLAAAAKLARETAPDELEMLPHAR